jgi:hypothetical protein
MIAWLRALLDRRRIRDLAIDPNSKCPACGGRSGELKCTIVEANPKPNATMMVEHTCRICQAKWYEPLSLLPFSA